MGQACEKPFHRQFIMSFLGMVNPFSQSLKPLTTTETIYLS